MTEPEIYAGLQEIFADVFLREDIVLSPGLTAQDVLGWDSFKQIEIIISAEEHFAIKLTTREIDRLMSVADLAQVIAAKAP